MADVSITILDNASPAVKRMASSLKDFRPALQSMALIVDKSFKRQFKTGGNPKWKKLSPITVAFRRNHSDKPLIDTGRLMRSYTTRTSDGIYNLSSDQITIGSNLSYAHLHQYGGYSRIQRTLYYKRWKNGYKLTSEASTQSKTGFSKLGDWDDITVTGLQGTAKQKARIRKRLRDIKAGKGFRVKTSDDAYKDFVDKYLTTRTVKKAKFKRVDIDRTIKVPARPVKIQPEDIAQMKTALERWISRQARNTP